MKKNYGYWAIIALAFFCSCNQNNAQLEQLKQDVSGVDYSEQFRLRFLYGFDGNSNGGPQPVAKHFTLDSLKENKPGKDALQLYYSLNLKADAISPADFDRVGSNINQVNDALGLLKTYHKVVYTVCKETAYTNTYYKLGLDNEKCRIFAEYVFVDGKLATKEANVKQ